STFPVTPFRRDRVSEAFSTPTLSERLIDSRVDIKYQLIESEDPLNLDYILRDLLERKAVPHTLRAALQNLPEVSQRRVTFTDSGYYSAGDGGTVRKNWNHPHCKASIKHRIFIRIVKQEELLC
ncbi:hypothetical protein KUCAC02_029708, partial [Chaenocephalus aceratus]